MPIMPRMVGATSQSLPSATLAPCSLVTYTHGTGLREIIDIKGRARGRIFLIVFVAAFLRVWFNKDIKSTIKMFKNVNTTSEVS